MTHLYRVCGCIGRLFDTFFPNGSVFKSRIQRVREKKTGNIYKEHFQRFETHGVAFSRTSQHSIYNKNKKKKREKILVLHTIPFKNNKKKEIKKNRRNRQVYWNNNYGTHKRPNQLTSSKTFFFRTHTIRNTTQIHSHTHTRCLQQKEKPKKLHSIQKSFRKASVQIMTSK